MKKYISLIILLTLSINMYAASVLFPGPVPGKPLAKSNPSKKIYTLGNNIISVSWQLKSGQLFLKSITNKLTGKTYNQTNSPAFNIKTSQNKKFINDWKIVKPPVGINLRADKKSPRNGKHYSGKAITLTVKSISAGITLQWTGELRENAGYITTTVKLISTDNSEKHITRVELFTNLNSEAPQTLTGDKGAPVVDKKSMIFCGMEVPFFNTSIQKNTFTSGFNCNLKIGNGVKYNFSSVIAVFPKNQLRRSILHYIERERARSYRPFLHYNCWFDLERKVSEKGMLDRITKINEELGEKRGVYLDAYVVDDGYDDWNAGFWVFNKQKFPKGFRPLAEKVKEINSHLGVWISPAAGYGSPRNARIKRAAEIGIKSLDLSNPIYYKWFLNKMTDFIKKDKMVYFIWDRLGGGVSNHFMALMDIASKLRKIDPELFLNTTVGTWQSPFWLQQVDCTWRGGQDMGFIGDGDQRDQWLTYRDAISYGVMKKTGFLYPLNALMNHGIVFANGHPYGNQALKGSHDMRNDVRTYFGGGYALQELYLSPDILKAEQWDAIAEAVKWAKKNENILVDAHFIGGNPKELEVYGFAAWQKNRGTLTFRNPKKESQKFTFDIGKVFELPKGAKKSYKLKSPYKDQRIQKLESVTGTPLTIELKPFEVLVFDAE
jgi:hypothetical protein